MCFHHTKYFIFISRLELEPTEGKPNDRDLLTALLATSSKLSFRAGASKSIVLAACTSCARSQDTALVFAEASSLLLEADVRLHVLQRDEMPLRRGKKVSITQLSIEYNFEIYSALFILYN
jgi:hypothetical protein